MVCAAELLNGNLLRDADFDSLFLCTAFTGIDPTRDRGREQFSEFPPVGRGKLPASTPNLSGFPNPAYRSQAVRGLGFQDSS